MMKKFFTILNVLLIFVAVYFSVEILHKLPIDLPDYVHLREANTQKVSNPGDETQPSLSYYQKIIERDLFNIKKRVEIKPEKIDIEALKKTDLKLKLWGTVMEDGDGAFAVIEEITKQKQDIYVEGDAIQNATVKMILRDKVVLSVSDKNEILEIETKEVDVDAKNRYGVTDLMDAVYRGDKDRVELLIAAGANVNAQDNYGDTALMNAALKGHSEIVELLITKGADIHLKDDSADTALMDSAKYARESACNIIALLIHNGAGVNTKNKYGVTALMYAALGGVTENVECLIAEGADVTAKSKSGETALKLATISNHISVIELLKKHGAKEE